MNEAVVLRQPEAHPLFSKVATDARLLGGVVIFSTNRQNRFRGRIAAMYVDGTNLKLVIDTMQKTSTVRNGDVIERVDWHTVPLTGDASIVTFPFAQPCDAFHDEDEQRYRLCYGDWIQSMYFVRRGTTPDIWW